MIVATGEFQRVLPCIHACQAGKDIYAEKPLTLYIREGRAARGSGAAAQPRVSGGFAAAVHGPEPRRLRIDSQRRLGQGRRKCCVQLSQGRAFSAKPVAEEAMPAGLDWDTWLNQAAWRPFNGRWMSWMRWGDFAGGEMTNWGATGGPDPVVSWGRTTPAPSRCGRSPGAQRPGSHALRPRRGSPLRTGNGPRTDGGAVFTCEKGKLEINRNKFTSNPPEIAANLLKQVDEAEKERKWSDNLALWQARWHMQDWLDCMRSRQKPVADVEIGQRAITVCHLANITRVVGRRLKWDPAKEQFVGDDEANSHLDRPRRKGFELPEIA